MILHNRLTNTANSLRNWSKSLFSDARVQLLMANEIILHLDFAQVSRPLTSHKVNQNIELNTKCSGMGNQLVVEEAAKLVAHSNEGGRRLHKILPSQSKWAPKTQPHPTPQIY